MSRSINEDPKSIGGLYLEGGMTSGIKDKIGVDEATLGDLFEDKLRSIRMINPCHVVICTIKPTDAVFATAQSYFEAGVTVTLIHNRRDAPSETQWIK